MTATDYHDYFHPLNFNFTTNVLLLLGKKTCFEKSLKVLEKSLSLCSRV